MWPLSEADLLTFFSEMSQKLLSVPWLPETKDGWKFPIHPAIFPLEILPLESCLEMLPSLLSDLLLKGKGWWNQFTPWKKDNTVLASACENSLRSVAMESIGYGILVAANFPSFFLLLHAAVLWLTETHFQHKTDRKTVMKQKWGMIFTSSHPHILGGSRWSPRAVFTGWIWVLSLGRKFMTLNFWIFGVCHFPKAIP